MHFEQLMNILSLWRDKNHDGVGYFVTARTAHSNTVRILVDRADWWRHWTSPATEPV